MDAYTKYLKKRMNATRLMGLLVSAIGVACILLNYFKIINSWLAAVVVCYSMGCCFFFNGSYQDVKSGKVLKRLNYFLAALFFIGTVALAIYAFFAGYIRAY